LREWWHNSSIHTQELLKLGLVLVIFFSMMGYTLFLLHKFTATPVAYIERIERNKEEIAQLKKLSRQLSLPKSSYCRARKNIHRAQRELLRNIRGAEVFYQKNFALSPKVTRALVQLRRLRRQMPVFYQNIDWVDCPDSTDQREEKVTAAQWQKLERKARAAQTPLKRGVALLQDQADALRHKILVDARQNWRFFRSRLWILLGISILLAVLGVSYTLWQSRQLLYSKEHEELQRSRDRQKIRRLSTELIRSQERERQKLAQELHDSVGQTLVAAKLNLDAYRKNPERYANQLSITLQFIDKASQELREIYTGLYPSILNDFGLQETIRWYSKYYLKYHNIQTSLRLQLDHPIGHEIEVNLYRILQELFSNIIKYARAENVSVSLRLKESDRVEMIVTDDGVGFSPSRIKKEGGGFGLTNINQRVMDLNGRLHVFSAPHRGTRIEIQIPLQA
jgi:signal transduction histidine kinase